MGQNAKPLDHIDSRIAIISKLPQIVNDYRYKIIKTPPSVLLNKAKFGACFEIRSLEDVDKFLAGGPKPVIVTLQHLSGGSGYFHAYEDGHGQFVLYTRPLSFLHFNSNLMYEPDIKDPVNEFWDRIHKELFPRWNKILDLFVDHELEKQNEDKIAFIFPEEKFSDREAEPWKLKMKELFIEQEGSFGYPMIGEEFEIDSDTPNVTAWVVTKRRRRKRSGNPALVFTVKRIE